MSIALSKETIPSVEINSASPISSKPLPNAADTEKRCFMSTHLESGSSKNDTSAAFGHDSFYNIQNTHDSNSNSSNNSNNTANNVNISGIKLSPTRLPQFSRSPISPTTRFHFKDLPPSIKPIEPKDLHEFVKTNKVFIFDIRPFNLYSNCRIQNAINLCIPLTLLKRDSYSLVSVLGSIDQFQKGQILSVLSTGNILVYDIESTFDHISFGLYQTCLKFLNYKEKSFNVYFLNGGLSKNTDFSTIETQPYTSSSSPDSLVESHFSDNSSPKSPSSQVVIDTGSGSGSGFSSVSGSGAVPAFPSKITSSSATLAAVTGSGASSSPIQQFNLSLSGFTLPSSTPSDQKLLSSIKRNILPRLDIPQIQTNNKGDEKSNPLTDDDIIDYKYQFSYPSFTNSSMAIPKWLSFISEIKENSKLTQKEQNMEILRVLYKRFRKIERAEQARLKRAITSELQTPHHSPNICSPSALCPGCDKISYKIPRGIEYGYKNRYNNIWPYEHSRVKLTLHSPGCSMVSTTLPDTEEEKEKAKQIQMQKVCEEGDDYFNANYIQFDEVSKTKYIATQNPLESTYEDFWKTIWYSRIPMIICLNKQSTTNLMGQGLKYFDNQEFLSSKLQIEKVSIEEHDSYILRIIRISKISENSNAANSNYTNSSLVYHLEFKNWPDFGVPTSFESILELIEVKNELILKNKLNNQLIVHCSAGCGRTGSFITLDMIIDSLTKYKAYQRSNLERGAVIDPWGEDDLVYKTVQYQRKQRISMVQNLDQYIVCYEIILKYLSKQGETTGKIKEAK